MTELSLSAQIVLDAFRTSHTGQGCLAAALRAAADQSENLYDPHEGKVSVVRVEHLIAIADELEAK